MTTKQFSTAQVLTVITGSLLCEVGDLYEILNHMTGENLFTHQLPRAADLCAPELLKQLPQFTTLPAGLTQQTGSNGSRVWSMLTARLKM